LPNFPDRHYRLAALLVAGCLAATGCGDDVQVAPVRGQVHYRGEPLRFGGIMFQPDEGQPRSAAIQPDGSYQLDAVVGENRVRITCYEAQNPGGDSSQTGESSLGKLLIPRRYIRYDTSGLEVDVPPEGLQHRFELEGEPGR
jgi:hypothetical protein